MAKKMFRVGVIGVGAIGQNLHLPGYAAAKNCEVVAVADPEKKCIEMCRKANLPLGTVYADYREMLKKEKLDVVSICTPNALHKEMAVAAAKAKCTILLEKPIALSLAEAKAIDAAVKANGVRLMTGFSHRFNDLNIAARKALKAGKIGKPQMIRIRFVHNGPMPGWAKTDWFYNPKLAGGGAALDMGIHAYDLAAWYIGPVTAVQAMVKTMRKKIKVDDSCHCLLDFGGSCVGHIEAGWTAGSGFCGVEIVGDNGMIMVDYHTAKARMVFGVSKADWTLEMKEEILAEKPALTAWQAEMVYFTENLGSKKPFEPTLAAGIAGLKVGLAAYQSEKTGKRITIR